MVVSSEPNSGTSSCRSVLIIDKAAPPYDFGPQHPLRPQRLLALLDLVRTLDPEQLRGRTEPPDTSDVAVLASAHDQDYIEAVQRVDTLLQRGERPTNALLNRFGLGPGDTPAFAGMHAAAAAAARSTVAAARAIARGSVAHAFSPSGGLHHAMRDRASGFCIYNDVVAGIQALLGAGVTSVLYLDFDAHHGDGVEAAFLGDQRVLTVSFHESGRYLFPGTGFLADSGIGPGTVNALNLPFAPFTQDSAWLEAVERVVPAAFARAGPAVVVSQHGCDGHTWDPLTHLMLTCAAFERQTALVHQLAHQYCAGRWLACGGGGYDPVRVVPRAWARLWLEMTGGVVEGHLPGAWVRRWQPEAEGPLPDAWSDPESARPDVPRRSEIEAESRVMLERALTLLS